MTIARASEVEGFVNVVGRVISAKPDVIVRKDGSGELNVVRGGFQTPLVVSASCHGRSSGMRRVLW